MNEKTRNDILLLVVGELDPARAVAVEKLLAGDAEARRFAEAVRADLELLGPLEVEPLSEALRERISRAAAGGGTGRTWRRIGLIAGAVAAAVIVMVVANSLVPVAPETSRVIVDASGNVESMELVLAKLEDLDADIEAFERLESESLDPAGEPLDGDLADVAGSLDALATELGLPGQP